MVTTAATNSTPNTATPDELDQELQHPARPRRQQHLEFLHADLPALRGHVRRGEEGQADQEVLASSSAPASGTLNTPRM